MLFRFFVRGKNIWKKLSCRHVTYEQVWFLDVVKTRKLAVSQRTCLQRNSFEPLLRAAYSNEAKQLVSSVLGYREERIRIRLKGEAGRLFNSWRSDRSDSGHVIAVILPTSSGTTW